MLYLALFLPYFEIIFLSPPPFVLFSWMHSGASAYDNLRKPVMGSEVKEEGESAV